MNTKNIIKFTQDGIGELTGFIDEKTGEPWFFAGKVCDCLKLPNARDSLAALKERHLKFGHKVDGVGISYIMLEDRMGRKQKTTVINESILYELIFRSNKEKAFLFQQWVFSEVLPSIRKTGEFRTERKLIRRSFTDTIKTEIVDKSDNPNAKFSYSTFTAMVNKSLGLPAKIGDRDDLPLETQVKLAKREEVVRSLIDEGKSYQEIKRIIESL